MVNRTRINFAQLIFCEIHESPVAKSHHLLGRGFNDSAGDIDFYQMFLSQSESTILHENIIYLFISIFRVLDRA